MGRTTVRRESLGKWEIVLPGLALAALWEWASRTVENGAFLFASPSAVLGVAVRDLSTISLYQDIGLTALETFLGLVLGSVLGTALGLAFWWNRRFAEISHVYVVALGSIPVVALAPIIIQWFGTGLNAKVALASFSTCFVALSHAHEGALAAQAEWLDFASALGASRGVLLRKIIFPGALSWVMAGARLSVGFSLIGAFMGEYVSSDAGLGRFIIRYGGIYDLPRVFLGLGLLAGVAIGLSSLIGVGWRHWLRVGHESAE